LFGDALAQQYVKTYFPPAAKAQVQGIVHNLRIALREQIMSVQWLAPQTKQAALQKLAATDVQVGYPDHWKDYHTFASGEMPSGTMRRRPVGST